MYGVTKIDVIEEVALISFNKIPVDIPLLAEIFTSYGRENILVDMISQTAPVGNEISIAFTCMDADMVKILQLSRELRVKYPQIRPMVTSGNCKIQLYGQEMRSTPGVFAKLLECLSGLSVELKQVTTSEVDISLLVSEAHLAEAFAAVKKAFEVE